MRELVDTLKQDKEWLTHELDRAHVTLEHEREEGRKLLAMLDRERQLTLPSPGNKQQPQGKGVWARLRGN